MSARGYEMEVTLTAEKITATARSPEWAEPEEVTGTPDISMRPTIQVLQEWLSRWGLFSALTQRGSLESEFGWAANFAGLPVPETFKILGGHLYGIAFPGDVDTLFGRAREAALGAGTTLRVILRIQDIADSESWMAALPWEFLYHPDERFFLAGKNPLVLSRYLQGKRARADMLRSKERPLRVLFVCAVPASEELKDTRTKALELQIRLVAELQSQVGAEKISVIPSTTWDSEEIKKRLADKEFVTDIVHIIGVCRAAPEGRMEIELPGVQLGQSEDRMVSLLEDSQPRLVVLHLLETNPFDYAATFGGHARALARAGVPAVLAMQYPMPLQQMESFTQTFYESLANLDPIDVAVQGARRRFLDDPGERERIFAAPVLYLQTRDGVLVDAGSEGGGRGSIGIPDAGRVLGPSALRQPGDRVADELHRVVRKKTANARSREVIGSWLDERTWTGMAREDAIKAVRDRMNQDDSGGLHDPVYTGMIMCLLDQGDHLGT